MEPWTPHQRLKHGWAGVTEVVPDPSLLTGALERWASDLPTCCRDALETCSATVLWTRLALNQCVERDEAACPLAERKALELCATFPELGVDRNACVENLGRHPTTTYAACNEGDQDACLVYALGVVDHPHLSYGCEDGTGPWCAYAEALEILR